MSITKATASSIAKTKRFKSKTKNKKVLKHRPGKTTVRGEVSEWSDSQLKSDNNVRGNRTDTVKTMNAGVDTGHEESSYQTYLKNAAASMKTSTSRKMRTRMKSSRMNEAPPPAPVAPTALAPTAVSTPRSNEAMQALARRKTPPRKTKAARPKTRVLSSKGAPL